MKVMFGGLGLVGLLALGGCDGHMPMHGHGMHHQPSSGATMRLDGNDTAKFFADPNAHAFYDLTVKTFAKGAQNVDLPSYQAQSYAIFRSLGTSMGVGPEAMQDHLKAIPGQMVKIVAEDPSVLKDYDSFIVAMVGPP